MKFNAWRGRAIAGLCAAWGLALPLASAQAGTLQDTIFSKAVQEQKSRMFMKLNVISAHVRTTSKDAQDVTGPVLSRSDFGNHLYTNDFFSSFESKKKDASLPAESFDLFYDPADTWVGQTYFDILDREYAASGCEAIRQGLGTPCGIKVKSATTMGTVAISLGYRLGEEAAWQVEAFVLAAPLATDVHGDGANQLRGQKIIETKLLPPIVTLGRQFGSAGQLRPYVGLGVSYAVFYDTRATQTLNAYQGGSGLGDTTVRIHNTWGLGPFVGASYELDDWQIGFTVGRLRFKPETTLTTNNTRITSDSLVLKDYGASASSQLVGAEGIYATGNPNSAITVKATGTPVGYTAGQAVPLTTAIMCDLARAKLGSNDCNLGTYKRRASTTLDATMFMLTIGRNF